MVFFSPLTPAHSEFDRLFRINDCVSFNRMSGFKVEGFKSLEQIRVVGVSKKQINEWFKGERRGKL